MAEFTEKVAVVTGASSGFGSKSTQLLAREGAKLALWDIAEAAGKTVAENIAREGGVAEFTKVDVRLANDIKRAAAALKEKYGKVDILINCAGVHLIQAGDVVETGEDEYDRVMDINVKGTFLACKHVIPLMRPHGGAIVNLASAWGAVVSNRVPIYCASKAAVAHLSKAMALDHGPEHIRVNAIGPGTCRTPLTEGIIAKNYLSFGFQSPDDMWESRREAHPLGRVGQADDVANLILFLVSNKTSWITGSFIIVDGGFTIGKSFKGPAAGA